MKQSSKGLGSVFAVLMVLFVAEICLAAQEQKPTPAQVRSRAEETLEWWNQIGKKLIAMAKGFPEEKYDFKVAEPLLLSVIHPHTGNLGGKKKARV